MRWILVLAMLVACGGKPKPPRAPEPLRPLTAPAYAHYLRGRIAMHEGRYAEAVQQFRAAMAQAPTEAPVRVALIGALVRAGRGADALAEADAAQKSFPGTVDVWLESGRVYRSQRRRKAAVWAYERAVALDPKGEPGYLGLAAAWQALGRHDRAEQVYRDLLAKRPDSVPAAFQLGKRLLERNQPREASEKFRLVLAYEPQHIEARVGLARSQRALGDGKGSIETLRLAFDRSGGDSSVGEELFRQLLEAGDRKRAVELIGLLDRDDLDTSTRVSFAYLYLQVGENSLALRLADRVLSRAPRSYEARALRAAIFDAMGQPSKGVPDLLDLHADEPGYTDCRSLAADLLAKAGDTDGALAALAEALEAQPRNVELIVSHAGVYELRGDIGRSRQIFDDALRAQPYDSDLLYAYGSFEDRIGDPVRAEEIVGRILEREPDNATALNFIGYSLADRGAHLDRAERMLLRAVQLSPGNGYVLDSLGWLQFRRGRATEALETLRRAARLAPREPEILWHLGELHLARGERRQALELLVRAQKLRPEGRVRTRIEARIHSLGVEK